MENKKITKRNSLLYTREWILKAREDGNEDMIPNRKIVDNDMSVGEIIELNYYSMEINEMIRGKKMNKVKTLGGRK